MKKIFHLYLAVACCSLAILASCRKAYEEVPLGQQIPLDIAFDEHDSAGTYAMRFLLTTYTEALLNDHNRLDGNYLDAATDDAISSQLKISDVENIAKGAYTASNPNTDNNWSRFWTSIRNCTIFSVMINRVPMAERLPDGRPARPAYRSEARFLRAWVYFELLKRYGGVPLLGDRIYEINDDIQLPRSSFADCVTYIVSELDNIKDSLRTKDNINGTSYGRITKGAAMSLKARVLLYAASPLFNGGNIESGNALTGYTNADPNRWKLAADAAKDVINLNAYTLVQNFTDVFITQSAPVSTNTETIFWRQNGNGTSVERSNAPIGYRSAGGDGVTSPAQNLVNAFPMLNGLATTDPASGYNPNDPYTNRDPRLKGTVFYNGMLWLNRNVETFTGGADRPGGTAQQTKTGYYLRKFMGNFEAGSIYTDVTHDFVYLRYAEILLNYAEALNEFSGPAADVHDVLHQLRKRAGIEAGVDNTYGIPANLTKEQMREVLRNERRIELAFEEHRFFDIRRWKIAETVMNQPVNGVNIQRTSGGIDTYDYANVFTPKFRAPAMYLYPIPYDEVIKNSNMKQNPGW